MYQVKLRIKQSTQAANIQGLEIKLGFGLDLAGLVTKERPCSPHIDI